MEGEMGTKHCPEAGWLALLALAAPGAVAAQTPDSLRTDTTRRSVQLPEFRVVAERPRAAPPAVTTVDVPAARLRRTESRNAYDLVRRATGIEVHEQGQGPGFASDVVLRGFSSDHSADVLLSIDGVPINLPVHGHVEGYADWSVLSPAAVSTFRVISGTASPLYGDFALGGVVEVFTAADAVGWNGALSGSSYGDASGWLRTGRRAERGGWLLGGDLQRQEGWRANSRYWLGNGLLRGWRRLGTGRLEGGLMVYGSTWDSPGFVSVSQFNAGDFQHPADSSDGGSARRVIAQGRVTTTLGSVGVDGSLWAQHARSTVFLTIPEDGLLEQSDEEDRRTALGGRLQLAHPHPTGDYSAGLDFRADRATYDLFATERRARVEASRALDGRYLQGGMFARWRALIGQSIGLDLGLRGDLIRYRVRDRLTGTGWRDETDGELGPKLGLRWLSGSGFSLQGSLSRGFRGAPGVIDDPTLPPVAAWTKEVGARYDGDKAHLQVAAFRLDVSNERIQDPVTREIVSSGTSVRQGINADFEVTVAGQLILRADGTVNDARISDPGSGAAAAISLRTEAGPGPSLHLEPPEPGDPVPNVSRYVGRIGAEWVAGPSFAPRVQLRLSGPYTPIGEPTVRTRSYATLDLGAALRPRGLGVTIDLDLTNVFDTKYPEIRASGFLNPGAPRTARIGLRFADRP
jgi:hypothetical protein